VVIVDIDEKSLAAEGRWPWRRDKIAALLDQLVDTYGVGLVGLDVVFVEPEETTGLEVTKGHRVIEIGCVEIVNRRLTGRKFHRMVQPDRDIDPAAEEVHGISKETLADAPRFPEIAEEFIDFVRGAELIIHNADFDVGFLDNEFKLAQLDPPDVASHCSVFDTLALARQMHPGQRNSLDALCKRYEVDASKRDVHGALIDSELLANVYLAMTGGQSSLLLDEEPVDVMVRANSAVAGNAGSPDAASAAHLDLVVIEASADEAAAHDAMLEKIRESGACVWDFD